MPSLNWQAAKRRARMMAHKRTRPMTLQEVPVGRSGYRGVRIEKGRYRAVIEVAGKRKHLGYFTDPVAAALAYDAEAWLAWDEEAALNFPKRGSAA